MEGSDENTPHTRIVSGAALLEGRSGLEATGSAIAYAIGEAKGHGDAGGDDHGRGEVHATGHATTQAPQSAGHAAGFGYAVAVGKLGEAEHTQWRREPVIAALKEAYPPDGLRPEGKGITVKKATDEINKLPEFKHDKVSEDTVDRAFKDIEVALKK